MGTAAEALEIRVPLQPKQMQLLDTVEKALATWICYGGPRGGGKSHGLRSVLLLRRLKYKGTRGILFRRKFDELWSNHITQLFDQYPFMREWYSVQHKELNLPNGSVLKFGYAERPAPERGVSPEIQSYQGHQYMDIGVDQSEQFTEAELVFLKTCNRWPGMSENHCKFVVAPNPGGLGHAFHRRVFFDRDFREREKADDYTFIYAAGWDNVGWSLSALAEDSLSVEDYYSWDEDRRFQYFVERTNYGRTLNALPQAMRLGHLLGKWDQFAGQYFDIWNPQQMTRRPETFELKPWYPRWISIDWGFAHNSAIHWHTQPASKLTATYREMIRAGIGPRALAQEIVDASKLDSGMHEEIEQIWLSPDAFAKRTNEDTIAEQMGKVFRENGFPYPAPADDDRVGGWMLMYQMLQAGEWLIGTNCANLIGALPMMTRDEKKVEDCVKFVGDDAADAARYGLKSRMRPAVAPLEERIARHLTADDPNVRYQQLLIAEQKERSATPGPVKLRRPWMARRWSRN